MKMWKKIEMWWHTRKLQKAIEKQRSENRWFTKEMDEAMGDALWGRKHCTMKYYDGGVYKPETAGKTLAELRHRLTEFHGNARCVGPTNAEVNDIIMDCLPPLKFNQSEPDRMSRAEYNKKKRENLENEKC